MDNLDRLGKIIRAIDRRKRLIEDIKSVNREDVIRPEHKERNETVMNHYEEEIRDLTREAVDIKLKEFGMDGTE